MHRRIQVVFILIAICRGARSIESPIPERELPPRDFNHHPYTIASSFFPNFDHPYAALVSKLARRGDRTDTHDIDRVSPHTDLTEYVRRVIGTPKLRNNVVSKNFGYTYASGKNDHTQEYQGGSSRGRYRVSLPDGRLQVVNYVADDDGYRADVSYEQQQKPIEENVRDLPPERDVHTRIAIQSANLAKIQSEIDNVHKRGRDTTKSRNGLQQTESSPLRPIPLPTSLTAISLPAVTSTYAPPEAYNSLNTGNDATVYGADTKTSRHRSQDYDYLNYDSYYDNYHYSVSPGSIYVTTAPEYLGVLPATTALPRNVVIGPYSYHGQSFTTSHGNERMFHE